MKLLSCISSLNPGKYATFACRGLKLKQVERSLAEEHYIDLKSKPFYPGLVDYILSAPVVALVFSGKNVVTMGTNCLHSPSLLHAA